MNNNICNICGANYEYKDGKWRCPACGAYKPEEISNEEETLLYNAAQQLRLSAFDEAEKMYGDIVQQYPKNSRGYWGLVLAKYGIKYEKDYDGKKVKMVPSCYAASYEKISDDKIFQKALLYADKDNKAYYESQAKRIEDVWSKWGEIAKNEEPYDIFISYKDSDKENGVARTQDSYDAYELYSKLKEKGYRVFYSRESLAGKGGEKYEPYIFNALNTAQVMIVYGTRPEYIESTWVKNEWLRFYKRMKAGQKQENSLILAYKGLNPSELPKPLCEIQGIDLGRVTIGFGDLEAKISEVLSAARRHQKIKHVSVKGREKRAAEKVYRRETVEAGKVTPAAKGERERVASRTIGGKSMKLTANTEKNLAVAEQYLARGQFAEAEGRFDEILKSGPRNGRALTGKLLAQANATDIESLEQNGMQTIPDISLAEKVLACAEKKTAESVLRALCAEVPRCFDRGDAAHAKRIVSIVREFDDEAVENLRGELYERGLRLIVTDEELAKYCLDSDLPYEEDDAYTQKLHTVVETCIQNGAFSAAEYYADSLKDADGNSYAAQVALLEIRYRVREEAEVFRRIEEAKEYGKIEEVLSALDVKSAAKWLQACFAEMAELLKNRLYGGAYRWIEICAKYEFESRKTLLNSLLNLCISNASMGVSDCFGALLTYVADGDSSVYAEKAMRFADAARSSKEFDAAKLYYGKVLSVMPDSVAAAQGKFFSDIRCLNDKALPDTLGNLTDWSCFEEVLVVQTDDRDDLLWIEKLAGACMENVKAGVNSEDNAIFAVFEKMLSYIPEASESVLLRLLKEMADLCLEKGLFAAAQKYYEMLLGENAEDGAAYWGLLQAKLKCRNEEELVRQPQALNNFAEFENAQICAAEDKETLEHYIDLRDRQAKHFREAKKRKRVIRIVSVSLAAMLAVAIALISWFTYYNSQSGFLYEDYGDGYAVTAGKFYRAEETLVLPETYAGKSVLAVGESAFAGHTEIRRVILPGSIESIGENAFRGCTALAQVAVAEGEQAAARALSEAPGGLLSVGDGAFEGCAALADFALPYGLEYIGSRAFAGTAFTEITIPNTVDFVGSAAFGACESLATIIVGDRDGIPTEWAEDWKSGCAAAVDFRLRVLFEYNGATGGNSAAEQYVSFGGAYTFPVPVRAGYAFGGWYSGETRLTDEAGASLEPWASEKGGTVSAKWNANVNEVIFDANGGEGTMPPQEIATDASAALSANAFTRAGYTFAGWATEPNGEAVFADGAAYAMGTESSYTLYAVWTANINEVIFDANGGEGTMPPQEIATDERARLSSNAFTRAGYTFAGWTIEPGGEAVYQNRAQYTMGAEASYTLYAVWSPTKYSIIYHLNGGEISGNPAEYTIESESFTLKNPVRAGYAFAGWTGTGLGGAESTVTVERGSTGNRTYTATWTANENKIVFHANGGEGAMSEQIVRTGETAALSRNTFFRNGYKFAGWSESEGGELAYEDGANYAMGTAAEYHLYAVWEVERYSVRYTLNGGTAAENPDTYTVESDSFTLANPVRTGYTFAGWTGTGLEGPTLVVTVARGSFGDREYSATWTANINRVIFDANGGEGTMPPQEIATDASAALSANAFTRAGYTFAGWATEPNGEAVFADGAAYAMGTESSYTLYAVWAANRNELRFDGNGADEGTMDSLFVYTGETAALPENAFEKTGHTFVGWATEPDGEAVYEEGAEYAMGTEASYTLYAVWQANEYSVELQAENGGPASSATVVFGQEFTLEVPAYEGYRFLGWFDAAGTQYTDESGKSLSAWNVAEDTALYAHWRRIRFTLTLEYEGADSGNETQTVTVWTGEEYTLPVPQRKNYVFGGWYAAAGGNGARYADEQGSGLAPWSGEADAAAYALWLGTDSILYELNEGGNYTVVGVTDKGLTEIAVPAYHNGRPVTEIAQAALQNCAGLRSLAVDASVTYIAPEALYGCGNLETLELPFIGASRGAVGAEAVLGYLFGETEYANSVEVGQYYSNTGFAFYYLPQNLHGIAVTDADAVGYGAFSGVSSLKSVALTAVSLGERAFYDCSSLADIVLDEGLLSVGASAFARCSALADIVLPVSVQAVGARVFDECSSLVSLTLPFIGANVAAVGAEGALGYLFGDLSSGDMVLVNQNYAGVQAYFPARLAEITLTNAQQLATGALQGLTMLRSVGWNDGLAAIGSYALYGCTGIPSIRLPASLKTVGDRAFQSVPVSVLELPAGLTSLGAYSLYGTALRTLLVPTASVVSLGGNALDSTHSALKIYVTDSLVASYKSAWSAYSSRIYSMNCILENGMAISGSTFLQYFGSETQVVLPANVTSVGAYAFAGTGVQSVVVPGNVRTVGSNSFSGCASLQSVRLLDGVRTIAANAFYGASALQNVNIPNTVTEIGANAFNGCASLTEVVVPNSVTSIGAGAFQGCNALVKMTLPFVGGSRSTTSSTPKTLSRNWNNGSRYLFGYIFGGETYNNGNSSTGQSTNDLIYQGESAYIYGYSTYVDHYYFNRYYIPSSLREIVITDATGISANAFYGCTMLTSITLNEGITAIHTYAFYNCDGLTEMVIPESVTSIGTYGFANSGNLAKITLPNGLTEISDYTFQNCTTLASVNGNGEVIIGASVTSIGNYAFSGCASITKVTLPNGLAEIGQAAFGDAVSLTQINIPASVVSIGASAFNGGTNLVRINSETDGKIILQEGLESIGTGAFGGLGKITEVVVPNSVTSIGAGAFQGCNALTKMTLPFVGGSRSTTSSTPKTLSRNWNNGSRYLFGYIFGGETYNNGNSSTGQSTNDLIYQGESAYIYGYSTYVDHYYFNRYYIPSSLREIVITDATGISANAFYNCTMLTSITLNEGITAVNTYAFYNCDGLTEITIPESVTSVGSYAFAESGNLTEVTLPSSLTEISDYIFSNCSSLTSVNGEGEVILGANVTSIGIQAFANCSSITSVTMQGIVTSIGAQAFDGCVNLVRVNSGIDGKVILQEGLTSIGNFAFRNLGKITEVVVPNSVTSIGQGAFQGCNSLVKMTLPFVGGSRSTTTSTPSTASSSWNGGSQYLFGYIFGGAIYLRNSSAKPPSTDTLIYQGENYYYYYGGSYYYNRYYIPNSLREIVITDATGISADAFYNCTMLTSIKLNEGITAIYTYAFYNCSGLTEMVIPESVASIGSYAFNGCSQLQLVQVLRGDVLTLTSLGTSAFGSTPATLLILVPDDAYSAYASAANWSTYADKIRPASASEDGFIIENGVLLHYIGSAETVTIPAGVTSIGEYAFAHNNSIKQVIIGDAVVSVGNYAFYNCTSLQNVTIGNGVQSIGSYAFYGCTSLQSVTYGDGLQSIGDYAFAGCVSLGMVNSESANTAVLGKNLATIGQYAFQNCGALKAITVEKSVTGIGVAAFMGCNSVESMVLPFVGADRGTETGATQVLGHIFGYKTSAAEGTTMQLTGYYYYIPQSLRQVIITDETAVAQYSFMNCSFLQSAELRAEVRQIGDYAFYGCSGLRSLTVAAQVPPAVSGNAFSTGVAPDVYVPAASAEAYRAAEGWKAFNILAIPEA